MKKHIYIIILFSVFSTLSFGQTRKAYIKAAEKALAKESYYEALTFFNEALDFDNDDVEILYKSAEAARNFNAFETAETRYTRLIDTLDSKTYPDAYVGLGEVLVKQGKYDKAQVYLNYYLENYAGLDNDNTMMARKQLANAEWAQDIIDNPDKSAEVTQLDINTQYSDFSPSLLGDQLYYATMSHEEEGVDRLTPRSISKLHILKGDETAMIEGDLNKGNSLVANPTFTRDGKYMYYTICEYGLNDKISCHIYERSIMDDGTYGDKRKLSDQINVEGFTSTQPNVGYDAAKDREVLYFVSDRDGGKGGYDIYYSIFNRDRELSLPVNMSEINTSFNEITPFYASTEDKLYFSTNGRRGLGGYDVYASELSNMNREPEHLSHPINSPYDDIYFIWNKEMDKSYFSSNRSTSAKIDDVNGACCFDIYDVIYNDVVIELHALTFDSLTRRSLEGATLYLVDNETGDTIDVVENYEGNEFDFVLKRDKNYTIIAKREHYDDLYADLSTMGISESTKIEKELYLYTKKTQLDLFTFDNKTKLDLAGTRIIVRDRTDGSKIIIDMSNLEGNDYHLYLQNGHLYDIEVSKFGYVTKHEQVDLRDISEPTHIERKVYLDVFEIEEYRDTDVYFENDYPNPKSRSVDTDLIYGDHYNYYIGQKGQYIKKIRKSKRIMDKEAAIQEIDNFFEGDVAGGYEMFRKFMRALLKELELGRKLQVELKGYASPVADSKYNKSLSERRVNCVKNEILAYKNGVFRKYLGSRQLIIKDVSYGETKTPSDVSDDPKDVISSVYAVKAAKERRVEIIRIKDQ